MNRLPKKQFIFYCKKCLSDIKINTLFIHTRIGMVVLLFLSLFLFLFLKLLYDATCKRYRIEKMHANR